MMRSRDRRQESSGPSRPAELGLLGIFLGNFVAMLVVAPLLRGRLGELWSLAAYLPIWALFSLLNHLVQLRIEARHDRE